MSGPALFGCPALEPLILFEPLLDVWQSGIAHWRLARSLALILTDVCCWLLHKKLGNGVAREPKVTGCCPLALALDQDPGANFISKCHGIHLSFPPVRKALSWPDTLSTINVRLMRMSMASNLSLDQLDSVKAAVFPMLCIRILIVSSSIWLIANNCSKKWQHASSQESVSFYGAISKSCGTYCLHG